MTCVYCRCSIRITHISFHIDIFTGLFTISHDFLSCFLLLIDRVASAQTARYYTSLQNLLSEYLEKNMTRTRATHSEQSKFREEMDRTIVRQSEI
jgi:hypothetical protein